MTLVERYLRAVRDFLPRGQQDDIINELSDSIQSRIEDEEATLGRPLQESEEVALLKGMGHPMAVAARYRGDDRSVRFGGQLIGPELFPTYLTVLRINLAITLIIGAVSLIVGGSIWSAIAGVVVPFVIQFTIVTLVFIVVDRRWLRDPDGWDPRTVSSLGPDVDVSTLDGLAVQLIGKQHPRAVAITTSVLEIGLLAIALTAWLAIGLPEQVGFMKPGPGWTDVWPAATVVILFALSIPVVNLFRPTWTRFRVVGHALTDIASIAILAVSLTLGSWVVPVDPTSATAEEQDLVELINTIVRISVAFTIVLTAVNGALEVRRFVRMGRPGPDA
jgi:hypothetical protein